MAVNPNQVRLFLGERVTPNSDEVETNLLDDEVTLIINMAGGEDFNLVMALAWEAKCGILSDLIDVNEDGSHRKLSQAYDHARRQANAYAGKVKDDEKALLDSMRATGVRAIDVYSDCEDDNTMSIFSSDSDPANSILMYPTKRFFRVKQ